MLKGFLTSCLAITVFAVGAQIASAQCGNLHQNQGCRISDAFNGMVGNAYGGANCGREISNYAAAALWSDYCNDNCSINHGCGGGCEQSCGDGCGQSCGGGCGAGVFAPAADACGGGCGGGNGHCLGGKLRGLFSGLKSGGCGGECNDGFGYPSGCATGGCATGGCDSGCGTAAPVADCGGCNQGCGGGCGGKLRGKFAGVFSHRSCGSGCGLFSRGSWHDRTFSNFYARHGATSSSYFGGRCGSGGGCGDFTSAVNGQLTGACGCTSTHPQMMTPVDQGTMQPQIMQPREVSPPVLPSEVEPTHEGVSYYQPNTNRVANSVLENRRGF